MGASTHKLATLRPLGCGPSCAADGCAALPRRAQMGGPRAWLWARSGGQGCEVPESGQRAHPQVEWLLPPMLCPMSIPGGLALLGL